MKYPVFVDNKTFFSMDTSKSEMEQMIGLLENLKKIHHLATTSYSDFDGLIEEYLKTGLEIFGMKIGIVSRIVGDQYIICNAISPDNSLKKDDVFPLEDTYCREVYHSKKTLGLPHVGTLNEMKDHPVYQNMKLESYISAPIYVYGKLHGTFNFSSTSPREFGFSEHERDFISLMARSIGSFLELSHKETELINANERLKKLIGIVAHDLRNPLGTIKGLATFIDSKGKVDPKEIGKVIESTSEKALELVYTILESAAMGTGKIDLKKETINFSELLQSTCMQHKAPMEQKSLIMDLNIDLGIRAEVDQQRMEQLFINLLTNATKYTPENGKVKIELHGSEERANVTFQNEVYQKSVDQEQIEQDLKKSVGFGLEIVREILKLHGSELIIGYENGFYTARFELEM